MKRIPKLETINLVDQYEFVAARNLAIKLNPTIEWVIRNVSDFDQVILEFGTLQNPNWIHISVAPRRQR